jgi:membrane fusion protein (multidrug efflux system)
MNDRVAAPAPGAPGAAPSHRSATSPPPPPAARRSWRARLLIPLVVLLLVAGAALVYWYVVLRGVVSTDDAYIDGNRVSLSSEIMGRIDRLTVDEGDTVQAGQLLVQLDDHDLQAQLLQARAALDHAQQSVKLADVTLDRARQDLARATTQLQGRAISQEEYDHAQLALAAAEAQQHIAVAQVGTARAQQGVVQARLADTRIAAPFHGVVAKRWVLAGDVIQPGEAILAIYDVEHVWVTANLEETKLGRIALGDSVHVAVDAYPGRDFVGTVTLIGAAAAAQFSLLPPAQASGNFTKVTQRIPIRISIARPSGARADPTVPLLPGMFVEVHVRVGARGPARAVPAQPGP